MIKDKVRIKIESGRGGQGSISTRHSRPDGGNGGKGGDVYFRGSSNMYDLGKFRPMKVYKADDGGNGQKKSKTGANAEDLYIDVPLVTEIQIKDRELIKIENHNQTVKVLNGGLGGFGNIYIAKNRDNLRVSEYKQRPENQSAVVELTLKLQSDVIFIGYPNAGKSSMLNALTRAKVKTASYAFTTIDPQIGLMDGYRLMDLPGLIEGSHQGKGVGTQFLKHTENSRLVAHFITLEESDPMATYRSMRVEMQKIDPDLVKKPEVIVLTKSDELQQSEIEAIKSDFIKAGLTTVTTSIIDDKSIADLKQLFVRLLS